MLLHSFFFLIWPIDPTVVTAIVVGDGMGDGDSIRVFAPFLNNVLLGMVVHPTHTAPAHLEPRGSAYPVDCHVAGVA